MILGYGGYQVIQGNVSLGTFVVFYQLTIQLLNAIQGIYNSTMHLFNAYWGIHKAKQLIDGDQVNLGEVVLEQPIRSLVFKNVSFSYHDDNTRILNSLSMEIPTEKKSGHCWRW
ncbi:ABC transporter ATP-binding protein [Paenibacillus paeoniae]|uniref:ABC transporter ATP-binding protein n=1 Tax=Paenibacillus paeoniae TaxID=2292705 RepID=UPI00140373B4|nr:ABC transporter ATP-binding protein [Paenibacillus paeoniae]